MLLTKIGIKGQRVYPVATFTFSGSSWNGSHPVLYAICESAIRLPVSDIVKERRLFLLQVKCRDTVWDRYRSCGKSKAFDKFLGYFTPTSSSLLMINHHKVWAIIYVYDMTSLYQKSVSWRSSEAASVPSCFNNGRRSNTTRHQSSLHRKIEDGKKDTMIQAMKNISLPSTG